MLGTFHEGNLEHITITGLELPEVVLQVAIPADLERVLPPSEDGVARLQLQQTLLGVIDGAEARGADIANLIDKVRARAADHDRVVELLEGRRGGVVVLHLSPLHAREVGFEGGTSVLEPVALLGGQISTPVADLDVSLQECGMKHGLGEVVSHRDQLLGTGGHIGIGAIGEGGALLLRIILALLILADNGVLGCIGGG